MFRPFHHTLIMAAAMLSLTGCGLRNAPSDRAYFPSPAPVIEGVALTPPPVQEDAHHRAASLSRENLQPAPRGTVVTLTAITSTGAAIAGAGSVTAEVGEEGRFTFYTLPTRCLPQATTQPCVVGASGNLLLSMGQGGGLTRSLATFQTGQVLDPVSEAVTGAILSSSAGLGGYGPLTLEPLVRQVRQETAALAVDPGVTAQELAHAVVSASASLRALGH